MVIGEGVGFAGPAVIFSFILAGFTCLFSALCYAELAASIPVSGSAYTYAYATLGELIAWIIGWDLILEYGVSVAAVAVGWGANLNVSSRTLSGSSCLRRSRRRAGRRGRCRQPAGGVHRAGHHVPADARCEGERRVSTFMVFVKLAVLIFFIVTRRPSSTRATSSRSRRRDPPAWSPRPRSSSSPTSVSMPSTGSEEATTDAWEDALLLGVRLARATKQLPVVTAAHPESPPGAGHVDGSGSRCCGSRQRRSSNAHARSSVRRRRRSTG